MGSASEVTCRLFNLPPAQHLHLQTLPMHSHRLERRQLPAGLILNVQIDENSAFGRFYNRDGMRSN